MSDIWDIAFYRADLTPDKSEIVTKRSLINANIGEDYWNVSIEQIPDEHNGKPVLYKHVLRRLIDSLHIDAKTGRGAIFMGLQGYGKTSAAAILLKSAMARGGQAYMADALALQRAVERRHKELTPEGVPVFDMVRNCHFVAIDDFGAEAKPAFGQPPDTRIMEEIIRHRNKRRLPTYITTNLSAAALKETYEGFITILTDKRRYEPVAVSGFNWRARD